MVPTAFDACVTATSRVRAVSWRWRSVMSSVHSGTWMSTKRTVTPRSWSASQGETLASCSRRVTTISSPGFISRPIARLKAKVSVVMLGPKTISSGEAALRKSAVAWRTSAISASERRLVAKVPP